MIDRDVTDIPPAIVEILDGFTKANDLSREAVATTARQLSHLTGWSEILAIAVMAHWRRGAQKPRPKKI